MDSLVHADIFFFVTTIAVVVIAAVFTVVLVYLAKILHDVKKITAQVHEETVLFREDIRDLREQVRNEGFKLRSFLDLITGFFGRKKKSRSKSN
jgi:hypothetical protein